MQRSTEIESIIREWFECVARGDATWLDRHLSRDADLRIIGTDPKEWLKGEQASDLLRADLGSLAGAAKFEVMDAEGYVEGEFGWGAAHFTIRIEGMPEFSPRCRRCFIVKTVSGRRCRYTPL